jgi:hypothetical protein
MNGMLGVRKIQVYIIVSFPHTNLHRDEEDGCLLRCAEVQEDMANRVNPKYTAYS